MNILNKPIKTFSFDDVVAFCKEGHIEGVQLDYKSNLPKKGLAKHFAAFSNTRGGVIIVGVDENNKTSIPQKWNGVKNEGKLVDRIHQYASNVETLPQYEVHVTGEKNNKVFLLIRIFEGDRTPYYVQNDSNLWVRTGNISNPIDIASPDAAEILFKKSEKASISRGIYINEAHNTYTAALKRAEKERQRLVAEEKEEFRKRQKEDNSLVFISKYYQEELGSDATLCTVLLQPFYPKRALTSPQKIKESLDSIRVRGRYFGEYPSLNVETIPQGILSFNWRHKAGMFECEQIYSHGLVYQSTDVLRVDDKTGSRKMWLSSVTSRLFTTLKAASNYYQQIGYQGGLVGYILLNGTEGVRVMRIVPDGWTQSPFFEIETKPCLLQKYRWDLDTDTSVLNNNTELQAYFIEKINEIYVGLNYAPPKEELFKAYLKQEGWLVE